MPRARTIIGQVLLGLAVPIVVMGGFGLLQLRRMGGLPPSYRARDGDSDLTKVAKTALPLIHALDHYSSEHHTYPNPSSEEEFITALQPYLSDEETKALEASNKGAKRWYYFFDAGDAYSLCYRLSRDPSLFYRCKGNKGYWEFDPGDGTRTKTIQLNP